MDVISIQSLLLFGLFYHFKRFILCSFQTTNIVALALSTIIAKMDSFLDVPSDEKVFSSFNDPHDLLAGLLYKLSTMLVLHEMDIDSLLNLVAELAILLSISPLLRVDFQKQQEVECKAPMAAVALFLDLFFDIVWFRLAQGGEDRSVEHIIADGSYVGSGTFLLSFLDHILCVSGLLLIWLFSTSFLLNLLLDFPFIMLVYLGTYGLK